MSSKLIDLLLGSCAAEEEEEEEEEEEGERYMYNLLTYSNWEGHTHSCSFFTRQSSRNCSTCTMLCCASSLSL